MTALPDEPAQLLVTGGIGRVVPRGGHAVAEIRTPVGGDVAAIQVAN